MHRQAARGGIFGIKGHQHHRAAHQDDHRQGQRTAARDDHRIAQQHAGGGTQEEAFKPRLPPDAEGLDHGQKHNAKPEEDRQDGTDGRILGQAGVAGQPVHAQKANPGRDRRSDQKPGQIAPIATKEDHYKKGKADTRQGRMAHGIADQRAFAQKQEGAGDPRRAPQKGCADRDQRGVIAKLQEERVQQHGISPFPPPVDQSARWPACRHRPPAGFRG